MLQIIKDKRKLVFALLSALSVLILVLLIFGRDNAPVKAAAVDDTVPVKVSTARAIMEPVTDYAEATGTVRPATESQIASKIMSNVAIVYVREGDFVKRGQVLLKLEAADLNAQVAQAAAALSAATSKAQAARKSVILQTAQSSTDVARAQAELTAAREQLALAKSGPRKQERTQAHLAVTQAKAQFKNAEIELARMNRLYDQDVVSRQRVDQAQMTYDVAKAQYEAALQQAEIVEEGSRLEEINTAQARVKQAEEALRLAKASVIQNKIREEDARTASSEVGRAYAALSYARAQQGYSIITSPVNGIVTARLVDPGDTVSPGIPMLIIEDNSHYRLEVAVPESDLPLLYNELMVSVRIDAGNKLLKGKISEIVPSGDPGSRKFLVKVDLPDGSRVKSGQFGRIEFPKSTRMAVTVPANAVHTDSGLTSVFVVHSRVLEMQVIKAGKTYKGRTEVISGLNGNEIVVISGETGLTDGALVKVRG